jgi:hypothetical protein
MGMIICTNFAPELKENPYKQLYNREYIRRAIENLIKLVEEKKEGIKCSLVKRISSISNYDAELIEVRCVDHTVFPTSEVAIPIVWTQELRDACDCRTVTYVKEYMETRDSALVDAVFEWIRCEDCKARTLWRIIESLELSKIIRYEQVEKLFEIDTEKLT